MVHILEMQSFRGKKFSFHRKDAVWQIGSTEKGKKKESSFLGKADFISFHEDGAVVLSCSRMWPTASYFVEAPWICVNGSVICRWKWVTVVEQARYLPDRRKFTRKFRRCQLWKATCSQNRIIWNRRNQSSPSIWSHEELKAVLNILI